MIDYFTFRLVDFQSIPFALPSIILYRHISDTLCRGIVFAVIIYVSDSPRTFLFNSLNLSLSHYYHYSMLKLPPQPPKHPHSSRQTYTHAPPLVHLNGTPAQPVYHKGRRRPPFKPYPQMQMQTSHQHQYTSLVYLCVKYIRHFWMLHETG